MDNLIRNIARHVYRNGKPNSLVAAGSTQNRGADADQSSFRVDERAARISRIDCSVGLDKVLIVFNTQSSTSGSAHNAHRYGLAHAERISDRQDNVADLNS